MMQQQKRHHNRSTNIATKYLVDFNVRPAVHNEHISFQKVHTAMQ